MGKRTRLDIIGDILSAIQDKGGRMKQTHIMYKANLSHSQLKSYLEELLDKEFIGTVKGKHNEYIIMKDKGYEFLEKFRQMKEFEKTFGL
ncbi:hypothetical protein D6764_00920 [Candidatus Woesearchaeota archaeon]|nr:MAG: hypothetical protein D6764_00920 [Candidatus Woesearchaeota archaeon]